MNEAMTTSPWNRFTRALTVLASGLMLTACAAVWSPVPLGEEPLAVNADEWEGLWTAPDLGLVIKVTDAKQGLLEVLMIDGTTQRSSPVQLMRSGGWVFASVREEEEEEEEAKEAERQWAFFRVVNKGETLVLWTPHADRFRRAVERGHLPGRVAEDEDGDPVYLEALTPEQQRVITESTQGVLMDWDEPVVLVRVSGGPR